MQKQARGESGTNGLTMSCFKSALSAGFFIKLKGRQVMSAPGCASSGSHWSAIAGPVRCQGLACT